MSKEKPQREDYEDKQIQVYEFGSVDASTLCMRPIKAVLFFCAILCFDVGKVYAVETYTLKGAVITPNGTMVPEFRSPYDP